LYPVAVVILGGLITSTLLDFFVTPAVFYRFGKTAAERLAREHIAKHGDSPTQGSHHAASTQLLLVATDLTGVSPAIHVAPPAGAIDVGNSQASAQTEDGSKKPS